MIIQFNFGNNTRISSVKVCIHFFGEPCIYIYIYIYIYIREVQSLNVRPKIGYDEQLIHQPTSVLNQILFNITTLNFMDINFTYFRILVL
jgi:hypothetical protein